MSYSLINNSVYLTDDCDRLTTYLCLLFCNQSILFCNHINLSVLQYALTR